MLELFFTKWYEITSWAKVMIDSDPLLSNIFYYSQAFYDSVFLIGLILAILSVIIYLIFRKENKGLYIKETITNMFTLVPFYFSEIFFGAAAVALYFIIYWNISWQLPINGTMFLITIIAADLVYFVEHYYAHKIRALWAAHSVHHSSPIMNISVGYRFSFLDPIVGLIFHIPLIFLGFHPAMVFAAEIIVLAYQFWIHTEKIPKLGFLEGILNTPSAHRVHHGSNLKYLDKNFGGITVLWDRLFGTYQAEEEKVKYGLTKQINSIIKDVWRRKGFINKIKTLYKGPGWRPKKIETENKI